MVYIYHIALSFICRCVTRMVLLFSYCGYCIIKHGCTGVSEGKIDPLGKHTGVVSLGHIVVLILSSDGK